MADSSSFAPGLEDLADLVLSPNSSNKNSNNGCSSSNFSNANGKGKTKARKINDRDMAIREREKERKKTEKRKKVAKKQKVTCISRLYFIDLLYSYFSHSIAALMSYYGIVDLTNTHTVPNQSARRFQPTVQTCSVGAVRYGGSNALVLNKTHCCGPSDAYE